MPQNTRKLPQNERKLKSGEPPQHGLDMRGVHVRFLSVCSAFCLNEHFCKTSAFFCSEGRFRHVSWIFIASNQQIVHCTHKNTLQPRNPEHLAGCGGNALKSEDCPAGLLGASRVEPWGDVMWRHVDRGVHGVPCLTCRVHIHHITQTRLIGLP